MISDFFPFYPKRPYPVCPVPSRVVEVTLRKQEVSLILSGPHLILVLSGIAHFGVEQALPSGDHPAGTVLFSLTPGSYTIGSGSAAVCSLCIYGFDVGQMQSGQCCVFSLFSCISPIRRMSAGTLSHLTEALHEALKHDPVGGDITAAGLLYPFFLSLAANRPFPPASGHGMPRGRGAGGIGLSGDPLIEAIDFIVRNHAAPIGAADIERVVIDTGGARAQTSRLFEAAFGIRPVEYLRQYRLHRAALLLEHSDLSLDCIAQACGFVGRSYLSALFTRYYGESPTMRRKRLRNRSES